MKPRVILIHGFNVRDGGAGTVLTLRPYFEAAGYRVKEYRYGFTWFFGVRMMARRFARILYDLCDDGDVIVAHSHGCLLAMIAAEMDAQFRHMVFINPALDRNTPLPAGIPRLDVWYSPSDGPVRLARWLPWHRWGDMGATGYRGTWDKRVHSHDMEHGFPVSVNSHSGVFAEPALSYFGPRIVEAVNRTAPRPHP